MQAPHAPANTSRAWYFGSVQEFLAASRNAIVGELTMRAGAAVLPTQISAWAEQIDLLRAALGGVPATVAFEFMIPRMGRRIDVVLLVERVVFAIEFKVGADAFDGAAVEQVWDYALDLKNFHEASHGLPIAPVLVPTHAASAPPLSPTKDPDGVYHPLLTTPSKLRNVIEAVLKSECDSHAPTIEAAEWFAAPYRPTPTIVEAARALYAQHSVEAIARHDAGAENLRVTSRHIEDLVEEARRTSRKLICFVTGVPGAGKTLVGSSSSGRASRGTPTCASAAPVGATTTSAGIAGPT